MKEKRQSDEIETMKMSLQEKDDRIRMLQILIDVQRELISELKNNYGVNDDRSTSFLHVYKEL